MKGLGRAGRLPRVLGRKALEGCACFHPRRMSLSFLGILASPSLKGSQGEHPPTFGGWGGAYFQIRPTVVGLTGSFGK